MPAKRKPDPHRKRLTIPQADESSARWYELQDDPSASVRLLIRESIQRDGYIDVINRPVDQQPRRGRPPASGDDDQDETPRVDESDHTVEDSPAGPGRSETEDSPDVDDAEEQDETPQAKASAAVKPEKNQTKEPELDDIFSSMRN